jgi:glycosyltransferase involved in cell wall biosynthesis
MKVIFYQLTPFALAHGGLQSQILCTKQALETLGVEVEFLRWYDPDQKGDVLHFFGRMPMDAFHQARQKRLKLVVADLLSEQGSRPASLRRLQAAAMGLIEKAAPGLSSTTFNWPVYRESDACIALTAWEARLMHELFGAPKEKVHVIPRGVEEIFLRSAPAQRGQWLVCTATISQRKRVLELAEAAVQAQTPLWIIGRPDFDRDPYAQCFFALAKQHPKFIRYEGAIPDRAQLAKVYREARGFVLLSAMESQSLSALEAAACECPLLLSDLPWARTVFGESASYCPVTGNVGRTAAALRKFYDAAPSLKLPPKPLSWLEVGKQLKALYEALPSTSR